MKKRKVDLLILSDIHLGTYGCRAKELITYLKSIKPKMVVLNGDIIDIWNFSKRYFFFFFFTINLATAQKTENVFIITVDGLRWQEVFSGADSTFFSDKDYVKDGQALSQLFWDNDTLQRRKKLMPFFWSTLAKEGQLLEKITLSKSQYLRLCSFIVEYFVMDDQQKTILLPKLGYTPNDNFYQAKGRYHALHTCNYWVNKGLKKIGVRTALWSPLDKGIFYQLQKVKPLSTGTNSPELATQF